MVLYSKHSTSNKHTRFNTHTPLNKKYTSNQTHSIHTQHSKQRENMSARENHESPKPKKKVSIIKPREKPANVRYSVSQNPCPWEQWKSNFPAFLENHDSPTDY